MLINAFLKEKPLLLAYFLLFFLIYYLLLFLSKKIKVNKKKYVFIDLLP